MDVRVSGLPTPRGNPDESTRTYLRAYSLGVTEEAVGRYGPSPNGELGRGAIGRVYVADDGHLGRQVAIKELLQSGHEDPQNTLAAQATSRFLREARVTGTLEHPGIVPVYELGRRADGTLYYTMRVVRGRTLAEAIVDSKTIGDRLALVNHFSGLCQAIAYAHSRGVAHRDIKPDNVMIGEFGETVVLDWGMAKLCGDVQTDDDARAPSQESSVPQLALLDLGLTIEGSVCGTPLYMSPEQASGRTLEVDQRSDVWSLGVVLYMILCGRPPFSGKTLLEIIDNVNAGHHPPLRKVDPKIPAELAAVVERALQPNQLDRYPSARELAREVQAYQAGTRVEAYEYSSFDLVQRFVARHRAAVTVTVLALIVTLSLGFTAYRRVLSARDRAIFAERRAVENEQSAQRSATAAQHSLGEVLIERAIQALVEGDSVDAELLAARALRQEERADARGVVIAAGSAMRPALTFTLADSRGCDRAALSFAGGLFACSAGAELRSWDLATKARAQPQQLPSEVSAISLATDASAIAVSLSNGLVGARSAARNDTTWHFEACGQRPSAVAVAMNGAYLACGNERGQVTIWRPGLTGSVEKGLVQLGQSISALAFDRGGALLVVGGQMGALLVYDTTKHAQRRLAGHTGTVLALALAEQGRYLASGGADRMLRFWDTTNGNPTQAPILHSDTISTLAWSDDRRVLALGGKDKTFRVFDRRTGQSSLARQHDEAVELVATSPDGSALASYSRDTGLRLWSLASTQRAPELNERGNVLALGLGTGTDQLLSAGLGVNGVCIWDLATGSCTTRLPVRLDRVRALAVSGDRQNLALAGSGSQIFIWDLARKIPTQVIEGLRDETRALAFSPDGLTLAAAGKDRKLRLFEASSGALLHEVETSVPVQTLSVVAQTGALLAGDQAGNVTVWDMRTGQPQASFSAHDDWILGSAVSPDGTLLATAGADRLVHLFSLAGRQRLFTLVGHEGKVVSVDFSSDGTLLASASEDKTVRVWDARTGRALATLTGHAGVVRAVRFTNQPGLLASGSDDGVIRLWQLRDLRRPGIDLEAQITDQFGLTIPISERKPEAEAAGL